MRFAQRFGLVAAAAALAVLAGGAGSQAAGSNADSFAVDVDTAGNSATALGARDGCAEVAAGGSITIDVTATNVPASTAMIAFAFALTYDPAVITVSAEDQNFLLASLPGSALFAGLSDPVPDTDGTFNATGTDGGPIPSSSEAGSGVLERLTLDIAPGAAPGEYPLTLTPGEAAHIDTQNIGRPPDALFSATLAVGGSCGLQGDVDCSNAVNSVDALKVLRHVASLSVAQNEPCADLNTGAPLQGDVDCSGAVNSVDALKVLRHVASLSVAQNEPCPDINT